MATSVNHQLVVPLESGEQIQILSFSSTRIMCDRFFWLSGEIFYWLEDLMRIYHRFVLNFSLNQKHSRQKM
jgi:hypothetical protein